MKHQTSRFNATRTGLAAAVATALVLPIVTNAERREPVYYEPADFPEMDIDNSGKLSPAK